MTGYVVRHRNGAYWCGSNHWSPTSAAAREFESWTVAELTALRDLPDPASDWSVVPVERPRSTSLEHA